VNGGGVTRQWRDRQGQKGGHRRERETKGIDRGRNKKKGFPRRKTGGKKRQGGIEKNEDDSRGCQRKKKKKNTHTTERRVAPH